MAVREMSPFCAAEELKGKLEPLRDGGSRIVFTNGVFDLLHGGHIDCLRAAKAAGDVLVVGLNSDESVTRLKGPRRPLLPLVERAKIISSLEMVDYVTSFDEDTPLELITLLRPHVLVKGGDYTPDTIVGREEVEADGGRVVVVEMTPEASSSRIIERILQSSKAARH